MKRYRVVGSSKSEFMDIEMNITFDDISIGKTCEVFGYRFTITQTGMVLVLANPDWVLTVQEVNIPVTIVWEKCIIDPVDLRINHEVDVFLKDKLIRLTETDRLKVDHGMTYGALFHFLKKEWQFIGHSTIGVAFPFDYDPNYKLFTMRDEWNFDSTDAVFLLRDGSFSRYSSDGRCI